MAAGADPKGTGRLNCPSPEGPGPGSPDPASDRVSASDLPRTLWIGGPTASGKSAAALSLAERLGGEILSVDSMQVFRGLNVGTAKPGAEDRHRVPHHLLDCVEPGETFDAARWLTLARQACLEIQQRGRLPIFCGGTGLYFRAWFHGLDAPAPVDPELRRELERQPLEALLAELRRLSPETWERIDRRNPRRVVRAVEILRTPGEPPGSVHPESIVRPLADPAQPILVLRRESEDLRGRIESRVDAMFASGLVEEVRRLLEEGGLGRERTALQAIGYRQVVEYLQGVRGLPETVELVKARTRQFAKRQMTWFRHQLPVTWIEVAPGEDGAAIADRIQVRLGILRGS